MAVGTTGDWRRVGHASSDISPRDEIELKFAVPADGRAALEKALKRGPVRIERMQAIYFDTADERLAKRGVSGRSASSNLN